MSWMSQINDNRISMTTKIFFRFLLVSAIFASFSLSAEIRGKVDIGPTYLSIDVLESGKTEDTVCMGAIKGDATILVWQGVGIKSGFILGERKGRGQIASFTVGVGHYTPITEKLTLFPSVGVTFSYLHLRVDFDEFHLYNLKERFRSSSPFIGLEFSYKLTDKWTLVGLYQYAWSHTHTKIKPFISDKSHSCGPNYALGLDYSFNDNWSLSFGVGYNITVSKEKHGLRGKGAKLGLAYYF